MADDAMAAVYANMALRLHRSRCIGRRSAMGAMNAWIIAVGSEMLTPFRVDTNSLAHHRAAERDRLRRAVQGGRRRRRRGTGGAVRRAVSGAVDVIVCTGGLGPTEDDITRDALAQALELPLDDDEAVVERIRQRFAQRGMIMPEINRRQAMVPRGAVVLENPRGTAPGLWLERGRHQHRAAARAAARDDADARRSFRIGCARAPAAPACSVAC